MISLVMPAFSIAATVALALLFALPV